MSIRFVDRADIVEVDAIMLFDAFERCGDELSEFAVAVILQVDGTAAPCVGCESVLGVEYGCRVAEGEEIRHASLLGEFQELALSCLFAPVVGAVSIEKALGSCARLNL